MNGRSRRLSAAGSLGNPLMGRPSPAAQAEEAELATAVRRAVAVLPPGQRAAVALFYLDGLTQAEVAAALDIEVGAVKTRLHKARQSLRRTLWSTWKEDLMVTSVESPPGWVDMRLEDVKRIGLEDPPRERSVLLLAETAGERLLPIWVGNFEGDAAAILLVGAQTPRPLTFPFTAKLLEAAGGRVQEVRISRLLDEAFYAEVMVSSPSGTRTVDARPSDAIALALAVGAPIRAERTVLEQAGRTRAELSENRPENLRSARQAIDAIRARLQEVHSAGTWNQSTLF